MPNSERTRCWHIRGYDSTTKIFDELIPVGQITLNNLQELLRSLAARGLSDRELVSAYAKRNTRRSNEFLRVSNENDNVRRRTNYYCGHNPHYTAIIVTVDKMTTIPSRGSRR